jgi:glycosyltransferase involved in cell wall biosynthesis
MVYFSTMPVSLICTTLNEGESMRHLLDSIADQTRLPDEVVICDGGSVDGTVQIIEGYASKLPITLIVQPGANISAGRNAAIRAAQHPILASTDAGVVLEPGWLEHLIAPLSDPRVDVVAGFFQSDPQSAFETALGAATLPEAGEIDPRTFMPSSRSVAFRRSAWEKVGGYPEWIDFCEDLIFDFRLAQTGKAFGFAGGAIAHFRPRQTLWAFVKQYFLYARGDGKANLFPRRHLIRYLTYLVAVPLALTLMFTQSPLWGLAVIAGGVAMVWTPYRRLIKQWGDLSLVGKIEAAIWILIVRVAGDIAKMAGYPMGRVWRWRTRPPDWRIV